MQRNLEYADIIRYLGCIRYSLHASKILNHDILAIYTLLSYELMSIQGSLCDFL